MAETAGQTVYKVKIIGRQSSAADLVQCPEANINTQQLPTFADAQITWHAT